MRKINERKLSVKEIKQRGIDLKTNKLIESIDKIEIRKMARTFIFETSYGYYLKLFNTKSNEFISIRVNKVFKLISIKKSENHIPNML